MHTHTRTHACMHACMHARTCGHRLAPLERGFVSASLARLFDPVNRMFPEAGTVPPSVDDVSGLVKVCAMRW